MGAVPNAFNEEQLLHGQAAISVSRDTTTGPQDSTATALTEVCAAPMDRDALRRWLADRPEITQRLLRVLARRLRRTDDRLSDLVFVDVAGRVPSSSSRSRISSASKKTAR